MYGNTERIGGAIAEGLAESHRVEVIEAHDLTPDAVGGFDALVVGGPTHAFGMAKRATREQAMQKIDRPTTGTEIGLRERLESLPPADGRPAATFATRIEVRFLPSRSAATPIAKKLRGLGYEIVGSEAFLVDESEGPVTAGEMDRARGWGRTVGRKLGTRSAAA
jgi:hypothetical protein